MAHNLFKVKTRAVQFIGFKSIFQSFSQNYRETSTSTKLIVKFVAKKGHKRSCVNLVLASLFQISWVKCFPLQTMPKDGVQRLQH